MRRTIVALSSAFVPAVLAAVLALTFLVAVVVVVTLSSAGRAVADAYDPKAASIELVRSILPPEAYDAMLDQMYQQMSASMQQATGGAGISASKQKDLKAAVKDCLPYDDLLSWTASVYSKHFNRNEIDDVAAFYRTATGKKLARLMPALTGEVGAKVGPLMMTRLPEALRKHGIQ